MHRRNKDRASGEEEEQREEEELREKKEAKREKEGKQKEEQREKEDEEEEREKEDEEEREKERNVPLQTEKLCKCLILTLAIPREKGFYSHILFIIYCVYITLEKRPTQLLFYTCREKGQMSVS